MSKRVPVYLNEKELREILDSLPEGSLKDKIEEEYDALYGDNRVVEDKDGYTL